MVTETVFRDWNAVYMEKELTGICNSQRERNPGMLGLGFVRGRVGNRPPCYDGNLTKPMQTFRVRESRVRP